MIAKIYDIYYLSKKNVIYYLFLLYLNSSIYSNLYCKSY